MFSTGPEEKGIETDRHQELPSRYSFSTGPEEKGIETPPQWNIRARGGVQQFSTGPEEKGIETATTKMRLASTDSSALALKKKGLRHKIPSIDARIAGGSALALKKKGLRPVAHKRTRAVYRFSTGPEEKGIETIRQLVANLDCTCSALALKKKGLRRHGDELIRLCGGFSTGPEEKGIETDTIMVRSPLRSSALALKKKGLRLAATKRLLAWRVQHWP